MARAQFCCFFVEFSLLWETVTKSVKEAVADPTWVLASIATRYDMYTTTINKLEKCFKAPEILRLTLAVVLHPLN